MSRLVDMLRDKQRFQEIYDRVYEAAGARTQVELAERLGIRQSSISDAKKNQRIPAAWVLSLFWDFGINPRWIVYGEQPLIFGSERQAGAYSAVAEEAEAYGAKPATAAVHSPQGAFGKDGSWQGKVLERIRLPQGFERSHLLVIQVQDSGMEPAIRRSALAGIDREMTEICEGDVYAIYAAGKGIVFKRLFLDIGSETLVMRSDNREYPENTMTVDSGKEKVVGRVVWVMQEA